MRPLVAYVSNEYFFAIPDVTIEFAGEGVVATATSSASGAVRVDLEPGTYDIIVSKSGYGAKRSKLTVGADSPPHQIRLIRDAPVLGYLWPKYARAGDRSELRIHANETYRAHLWRYGWEREYVADLSLFGDREPPGSLRQTVPDGDFTQTGAAWHPHLWGRQHVTAPDRSGLYYVHVETASGGFTSFPWIVTPQRPAAKLAVLASNITWNAYNDFGGRSNYVSMNELPPVPAINVHQEGAWGLGAPVWREPPGYIKWAMASYAPLSFDRPEPFGEVRRDEQITDPLEPVNSEHLAPADWRLLGWLERESFAYDLYAETQLHDGSLALAEYDVVVLNTHPEYWTRSMYDRLYDWVFERGGKLVYLGGNGIDCEVEVADSQMTVLNGVFNEWDGKAENRWGARNPSTGALLGVVLTLPGLGTAAPFKALDAEHWIFEGTGLRNGDLFGFRSLSVRCPGGASGGETDKVSAHAPPGTVVLARGTNENAGGSEITYFETTSGGRVFSGGSMTWVPSVVIDDQISRITGNVLRNFLRSADLE